MESFSGTTIGSSPELQGLFTRHRSPWVTDTYKNTLDDTWLQKSRGPWSSRIRLTDEIEFRSKGEVHVSPTSCTETTSVWNLDLQIETSRPKRITQEVFFSFRENEYSMIIKLFLQSQTDLTSGDTFGSKILLWYFVKNYGEIALSQEKLHTPVWLGLHEKEDRDFTPYTFTNSPLPSTTSVSHF